MTYEDLKNYLKTQDWKVKKQEQDILGGNPNAVDAYDMLSGMDSGGISGIIRNPRKIKVEPIPEDPEWPDLRATIKESYYSVFDNKIIDHLTNLANQYKRVMGSTADPVYDLIKTGKINVDNIGLVSHINNDEYDKLRRSFRKNIDHPIPENDSLRVQQSIDNFYHNDEPDKRALEAIYDSIIARDAFTPDKKAIRYDYYADPLIPIDFETPSDIPDMIKDGFISQGSLRNKRIGLNDYINARVRYDAVKNTIGRQEWESTKPILDLGEYAWHKLPYDTRAQQLEGRKMSNCAGKYCVASPGEKDIYSLRRSDTNTPKVNFVHNADNTIEQIKGIANSEPKEEYLDAIDQLKKYLGIR